MTTCSSEAASLPAAAATCTKRQRGSQTATTPTTTTTSCSGLRECHPTHQRDCRRSVAANTFFSNSCSVAPSQMSEAGLHFKIRTKHCGGDPRACCSLPPFQPPRSAGNPMAWTWPAWLRSSFSLLEAMGSQLMHRWTVGWPPHVSHQWLAGALFRKGFLHQPEAGQEGPSALSACYSCILQAPTHEHMDAVVNSAAAQEMTLAFASSSHLLRSSAVMSLPRASRQKAASKPTHRDRTYCSDKSLISGDRAAKLASQSWNEFKMRLSTSCVLPPRAPCATFARRESDLPRCS